MRMFAWRWEERDDGGTELTRSKLAAQLQHRSLMKAQIGMGGSIFQA